MSEVPNPLDDPEAAGVSETNRSGYAAPDAGTTRRDPPRPGDGGRLVACSVIVLAGAVMMAGGVIARAAGSTAGDSVAGGGVVLGLIGMLGFLTEFVRGYRR